MVDELTGFEEEERRKREEEERRRREEVEELRRLGLGQYADYQWHPEETPYEDGFTIRSIIGAVFVGLVIMPGSIYLSLVLGISGLQGAAEWTTVVLFTELAKRSFTALRKQEQWILYGVAGAMAGGGLFGDFVWRAYLVQSPFTAGYGITPHIPGWWCPPPSSEAIAQRTFLHKDWLPVIGLFWLSFAIGQMDRFGLGYILFRLTSDVERLPFPLAPIAAEGATALAEATTKGESWRWQVFSTGTVIGVIFNFFYGGIPAFTGAIMTRPIQLLPIPFIDLTPSVENFLPATPLAINSYLIGPITMGFILPYPVVLGGFIASCAGLFINPILFKIGILHTWRPGLGFIGSGSVNDLDFWFSYGIGRNLAIAAIGIIAVIQVLIRASRRRDEVGRPRGLRFIAPPPGRGDYPIKLALFIYIVALISQVYLNHKLLPTFPLWIIIAYGCLYSPIVSYVNARLYGLTGSLSVGIPYLFEATILLTRYKKFDVWFAPLPIYDQSGAVANFKQMDLVRCKIISLVKATILTTVLSFIFSFIFWSFFWKLAPIPSIYYPYVARMWPINAFWWGLWRSAITTGNAWLMQAFNIDYVIAGFGINMVLYGILAALGVPLLMFYGLIGVPGNIFDSGLTLFGAILGKRYFMKRFGKDQWIRYVPVLLAGIACGSGLIMMLGVAVAMISKAVISLPY